VGAAARSSPPAHAPRRSATGADSGSEVIAPPPRHDSGLGLRRRFYASSWPTSASLQRADVVCVASARRPTGGREAGLCSRSRRQPLTTVGYLAASSAPPAGRAAGVLHRETRRPFFFSFFFFCLFFFAAGLQKRSASRRHCRPGRGAAIQCERGGETSMRRRIATSVPAIGAGGWRPHSRWFPRHDPVTWVLFWKGEDPFQRPNFGQRNEGCANDGTSSTWRTVYVCAPCRSPV